MENVIYMAVGLTVGALVMWMISSTIIRNRFSSKLGDAEKRANLVEGKVIAKEESADELRIQNKERSEEAARDFEKLRVQLGEETKARVKAETEANEMKVHLSEEKKFLSEAKEKLKDAFKALASDTLKSSNEEFLTLAREIFKKTKISMTGDLEKRQEAIKGLVTPLSDSLKRFEGHVRELENNRKGAYSGIEVLLKGLTKETGNLASALRTPQVRGRWGEMTLRRVVEVAGMSEHCDFTEQVSADTDNGRVRPDLIIRLPAERRVIVDAKVSLDAYLKATSCDSPEESKEHYIDHARQVRAHMKRLSGKSYWEHYEGAHDYVVMFIPWESFFATAVHYDLELMYDAAKMDVMLATPTTLIPLLRAFAYNWRQEQQTKNARIVSQLGRELYENMKTLGGHLSDIGKGLKRANVAYDSAIGSIESRVLPKARRFKELGITVGDEIPLLEPVNVVQRPLVASEFMENDGEQNGDGDK